MDAPVNRLFVREFCEVLALALLAWVVIVLTAGVGQ
jgi:hypothetical protein